VKDLFAEISLAGGTMKLRCWRAQLRSGFFVLWMACVYAGPVHAARIVYLAEQQHAYLNELYLVDSENPGMTTQLNLPLTPLSNGVLSYAVSPSGAQVVFSADQTTVGDNDLYLVDIAAPGHWTRIGNLAAGHQELRAKFSPDGKKLAFTASDDGYGNTQLYLVDLANPGMATRLNGDLAQNGAVSMTGFQFTPDGTHVVYVAGELQARFELYAVKLSAPGHSVLLNASGGSVGDSYEGRFHVLPDSQRIVYSAVWQNPGVRELHVVSLDHPGQPATLNAPLQPAGYVHDFAVSPDGRYATYTADQDTDGKPEVYVVDTDNPGISTKINGPVQSVAGLAQFTPDSQRVIYAGDEERDMGARDLYRVAINQPTVRERLNAPLAHTIDINSYTLSADGAHAVYRPGAADGFDTELMLVQMSNPGTAVRINGPLPAGALDPAPGKFSPDGKTLAFLAVESIDSSIQELFFARTGNPGVSMRLNGPLAPMGIVSPTPDSFQFLPEASEFLINAGLNDAWYNPDTSGQGFLMTVFPRIKQVFIAWFTYDTERPPGDVTAVLGEPGHRWLTAQGPYEGNTANLTLFVTKGGVFDTAEPAATTNPAGDGTMKLEFTDCETGLVTYEITSLALSGTIPIQRIARGNIPLCESLSTQ